MERSSDDTVKNVTFILPPDDYEYYDELLEEESDEDIEPESFEDNLDYKTDIKFVGDKPVIKCIVVVKNQQDIESTKHGKDSIDDDHSTKKTSGSTATSKSTKSVVSSKSYGQYIKTRVNYTNHLGYYIERNNDYPTTLLGHETNSTHQFAGQFQPQENLANSTKTSYPNKRRRYVRPKVDCRISTLEELCKLSDTQKPKSRRVKARRVNDDDIVRDEMTVESDSQIHRRSISCKTSTTKSLDSVVMVNQRDNILYLNRKSFGKRDSKLVRFSKTPESEESTTWTSKSNSRKLHSCLKGSKSKMSFDDVIYKNETVKTSLYGNFAPTCFPIVFNKPRSNKKLLVLDLDETLANFLDVPGACSHHNAKRPFLDEFLAAVYRYYDIVIWGDNRLEHVIAKVTSINLTSSFNYKLFFCIDMKAITKVYIPKLGIQNVKPLSVIWDRYPQFNYSNTLIVDNQKTHFYYNTKQGILIAPYLQMNKYKDRELMYLAKYLRLIATTSEDFSELDHSKWREQVTKTKALIL